MRVFGLEITKAGAPVPGQDLRGVYGGGGWYPLVREPFTGAWQKNESLSRDSILSFHANFACTTLIAGDIAKLGKKLKQLDTNGVWTETANPAYSPVLRVPNHFQTHIQFWENWMLSKLNRGNTYVLKERDNRNVVVAMYILDPCRVTPLVTDDGDVYYRLGRDNLADVEADTVVPAREIIHDRFNCLFHPLVGVPPLFANAMSATQGINIQKNSIALYANHASPGGILTAPGKITQETADRLKERWDTGYGGENRGKVAVLGDGLKFEKMALTAVEGQLIEQLKWTAEVVCSTYHVQPYKVGLGPVPAYPNVQALNVDYYSTALQYLIESAEECMSRGLGLPVDMKVEIDEGDLLRMDSLTQIQVIREGVSAGVVAPNEGRKELDYKPAKGGDTPYLQQQNFSLEALAKRDASDNPFGLSPARDQVVVPPDNTSPKLPPPEPAKYMRGSLAKALEYELAA